MKTRFKIIASFFLTSFVTVPLQAGDFCYFEPPLFMGGLELPERYDISVDSEDIYVAPTQVKIRLLLFNESSQDITTRINFPVAENYSQYDLYAKENPLDFKVWVNGKEIGTQLERNKPEGYVNPIENRLVYYWQQAFPKKGKVVIEYVYKSSKGSTEMAFWKCLKAETQRFAEPFCMEPSIVKKGQRPGMKGEVIYYNFATGRWKIPPQDVRLAGDWKGPIKEFKLVIDKEKPGNLISLCIDGIKKISPTQFEVVKRDFIPDQDLKVLFIRSQ